MSSYDAYATENILTPSQLISMEMVKNPDWLSNNFVSATIGSAGTLDVESEYANFAIADVDNYVKKSAVHRRGNCW